MIAEPVVLSFPRHLVFPDVDPPVLARDEGISHDARSVLAGAWTNYLHRMLPPIAEPPRPRMPCPPPFC